MDWVTSGYRWSIDPEAALLDTGFWEQENRLVFYLGSTRRALIGLVVMSVALLGGALPSAAERDGTTITGQHFQLDVRVSGSLPRLKGAITGHVRELKAADAVAFQAQQRGRWVTLTHASLVGRRAFSLQWRLVLPKHPGPWIIGRFQILGARRVLDSIRLNLARPPIRCQPASAPAHVPPGDGWIVGGLYRGGGGPAPGIPPDCSSVTYTVRAFNSSGQELATQAVPGWHSYALVLPAGTYTLRSQGCVGHTTVIAGREAKADTRCPPFP